MVPVGLWGQTHLDLKCSLVTHCTWPQFPHSVKWGYSSASPIGSL